MAKTFKRVISLFFSSLSLCFFGYNHSSRKHRRVRVTSHNDRYYSYDMPKSSSRPISLQVTVIGYVDRNKVLKAIRRAGKRAEFWPYPNPPLYFTSATNYFKDMTHDYKESYNYYRHGYNVGDRHGTLPISSRGDDKVSNMFNDDNVNACSLM
ncbi:Heavy metal-associated isoprenylated plant protein 44 [Bienertia sinuspersici]